MSPEGVVLCFKCVKLLFRIAQRAGERHCFLLMIVVRHGTGGAANRHIAQRVDFAIYSPWHKRHGAYAVLSARRENL